MGPRPRIPKRGEIYCINPNPVAGREMRDRHYWIVVTPEAVNVHGVSIAVVISTAAEGARGIGLAVPVSGDGVTGVAICSQVRSFDIRARVLNGSASYAGRVDATTVDEIAARLAGLVDPA